jgi:hypothetical protein
MKKKVCIFEEKHEIILKNNYKRPKKDGKPNEI